MENVAPRPKYRRTHYLVKTRFQLSYVGLILMLMIITACICSYAIYYTCIVNLGEKLAAVYPQGKLVSIVEIVNRRIISSMMLITPLIVIMGIYFSHKIAGPIFRIERFLKNMATGDLSDQLFLRKGDELVSLADGINDVRENLISMMDAQKEKLDGLSGEIEELKSSMPPTLRNEGNIIERLNNINGNIKSMKASLDKYKLRK